MTARYRRQYVRYAVKRHFQCFMILLALPYSLLSTRLILPLLHKSPFEHHHLHQHHTYSPHNHDTKSAVHLLNQVISSIVADLYCWEGTRLQTLATRSFVLRVELLPAELSGA